MPSTLQIALPSTLRRIGWKFCWLLCFCAGLVSLSAAEVMPPRPRNHFNDYARVVSGNVAQQLDQRLADFERETSDQVVVAVFKKMQTDSSLDDYAYRIFHQWQIGLKDKNNGVVLFVFIEDRKMRIQTGYGLEGALPDALAKQIIEDTSF